MIANNWKDMPEGREKYQMYLASREWAEKRDAVRERCGGKCERCKWNDSDHVHHKTYIRKYDEKPYDLQALCKGCHDFTHNKSDSDPLMDAPVYLLYGSAHPHWIRSVYLAGKISGTTWRDEIVKYHEGDWTNENHSLCSGIGPYKRWPKSVKCLPIPDGRVLNFTGPYWEPDAAAGGDMGHLSVAAMNANNPDAHGSTYERRRIVRQNCLDAICRSDLVFAWIDSPTAYGTIAEVAYAESKGKLVVLAFPTYELAEEMWFINEGRAIIKDTAKDAWDALMTTSCLDCEKYVFPRPDGTPRMSADCECSDDEREGCSWHCESCEKSVRSVMHYLLKNQCGYLTLHINSLHRTGTVLEVEWSSVYAGEEEQHCREFYSESENIAKLITDFWRELVGEGAKVVHTTRKETQSENLPDGSPHATVFSATSLGEDYCTAEEFGKNANEGKGLQ